MKTSQITFKKEKWEDTGLEWLKNIWIQVCHKLKFSEAWKLRQKKPQWGEHGYLLQEHIGILDSQYILTRGWAINILKFITLIRMIRQKWKTIMQGCKDLTDKTRPEQGGFCFRPPQKAIKPSQSYGTCNWYVFVDKRTRLWKKISWQLTTKFKFIAFMLITLLR